MTQFFDPKLGMQTSLDYTLNPLNANNYIKKRILVTKVDVKAYTSIIYNYPLSEGAPYTYYNSINDDVAAYN